MTALDLRAQRAAAGIRSSVAASPATPAMDLRGAARMRFMTHASMGVAAAAAAVAAFVIMGSVFEAPSPAPAPPAGTASTTTTVAPPPTSLAPSTTAVPTPVPPPSSTTTTTIPATTTSTTTATTPPDTTPPAFKILSPEHNQTFEVKVVTFSGTVEPGATVFAGRYEATVAGGEWSIALTLVPGRNTATLVATDAAGNQTSATVVAFLEVPKEDPPQDWEFTANRVNGSSTKNPPYDVYWGTGKPGTAIQILSEFGSGSVEVDAEGGWEVKVYFPTAPPNDEFVVKVKDFTGAKFTFGFTYIDI
jgi:Glucodextranase, domain B